MSKRSERYSDFDIQVTPEEMEQDHIQWDDEVELQDEIRKFLDATDDPEPFDIDDDYGMNPYDGTPEGWDSVEGIDEFDF